MATALNSIIAALVRPVPGPLHRNDTGAIRSGPQSWKVEMPG
ncbi:hypothetical protein SPHINGO8AM_120077 [Sphingomonas sp. 8AM]|nr:hypothetical protein SPHINGO8AM_120077 [Sphingomonas sp. 8AM]